MSPSETRRTTQLSPAPIAELQNQELSKRSLIFEVTCKIENVTNFSSLGLKDIFLCSRDQKHWISHGGGEQVVESKYHALVGDNSWDGGSNGRRRLEF